MRFVPEKFTPPLSLAAVEAVPLVHFIVNVIDAVTLLLPEGSIAPKSSSPGGEITLHLPTTIVDMLNVFDPAAQAGNACSVA
jgi:hypothetical protein